ncbi:MAG TPA: hypothetical protein VF749_13765, partial [Candidatus Acidoferrum sp.]
MTRPFPLSCCNINPSDMRALSGLSLVVLLVGAAGARQTGPAAVSEKPLPGKFTDVTSALGLHFNYLSSHTPKH